MVSQVEGGAGSEHSQTALCLQLLALQQTCKMWKVTTACSQGPCKAKMRKYAHKSLSTITIMKKAALTY